MSAALFWPRMWPKSMNSIDSGVEGYWARVRLANRSASSTGKRSSVKPLARSVGAGASEWSTSYGEWCAASSSSIACAGGPPGSPALTTGNHVWRAAAGGGAGRAEKAGPRAEAEQAREPRLLRDPERREVVARAGDRVVERAP